MATGIKALALLSGGLDSTLAARLVMDQDVDVEGVTCISVFTKASRGGTGHGFAPRKAARQLGIHLNVIDFTDDFLNMIRNPNHGYGTSANPCIDCRILVLKTLGK